MQDSYHSYHDRLHVYRMFTCDLGYYMRVLYSCICSTLDRRIFMQSLYSWGFLHNEKLFETELLFLFANLSMNYDNTNYKKRIKIFICLCVKVLDFVVLKIIKKNIFYLKIT